MPNHLINETSPYLLQHAHNPVDWYPWGPEALENARREHKLIFVSIGYAACHWCHVMERESFEDSKIAELLNRHFISIKVDREERPDLDMIYMQAVIALNGQGGWPLNVFLTPDGHPFYGGTYFPPVASYEMPAFQQVVEALANLWNEDPQKIEDTSSQLFERVAEEVAWKGQSKPNALKSEKLNAAAQKLIDDYDWQNGGWGNAPKFPAPMTIDFLLTQAGRGHKKYEDAAVHALKAMQRGGMYDVVGGGFHRYATDTVWLVPHFEKMLYDNAQLSLAYLHAYQVTGDISFRKTVEGTLDFILRELTGANGRFFSSLDADSEGEEGKFYTWSIAELKSILLKKADFELFGQVFNLPKDGNFDGKIILQQVADVNQKLGQNVSKNEDGPHRIDSCLHKLLEYRTLHRIRPATDDKTLVAWNAFALQAFAEAGRVLDRGDYLAAAKRNADFLLSNLWQGRRLFRSWRAGVAKQNGTLEDYAALAVSLLALYQSDFNLRWYQAAAKLAHSIIEDFLDQDGGFYLTRSNLDDLPLRPKDLQDNATPSANALAAYALLLLSAYSGNRDWQSIAENSLAQVQDIAVRYPTAFSFWLKAMDFAFGPVHQVALVWPDGKDTGPVLAALRKPFRPRMVIAASTVALVNGSPELLANRPSRDDAITAYICHGFVCDLPAAGQEQILASLKNLQ